MDICSSGHDEIVYDGRNCPGCTALDTIAELKDTINTLESELYEARNRE